MIRILTINEIMVEPTAIAALDTDLNILFFSHLFNFLETIREVLGD